MAKSLTLIFIILLLIIPVSFAKNTELEEIQKAIKEKGAKWVAGETSVSNLSDEEKQKLVGLKELKIDAKPVKFKTSYSLPGYFDWRNKDGANWITLIRDQALCGSCWAFATLGAMEAEININNNVENLDFDLSEQYLISCTNAGNCSHGGDPVSALEYIKNNNMILESCFQYTGLDSECTPCAEATTFPLTISDYTYFPIESDQLKTWVVDEGPVIFGFKVYDDFYSYSSGVYSYVWGSLIGYHAMVLVGYSDIDGAWIIKNSWGSSWGEAGYIRIAYSELDLFLFGAGITDTDRDGDGVGDKIDNCPTAANLDQYDYDNSTGIQDQCNKNTLKCGDVCDIDDDDDGIADTLDMCPYTELGAIVNTTDPAIKGCSCYQLWGDCDDALFCNGNETCDWTGCQAGTPIDCSANDISFIGTCDYDPDAFNLTWDFRPSFTSVCSEPLDICSFGNETITHICLKTTCGAECVFDYECNTTECDYMDGCVGNDYYDYLNVENNCLNCTCENHICDAPNITINDTIHGCIECFSDSDCDDFDECTSDICSVDLNCTYLPNLTTYYLDFDNDTFGDINATIDACPMPAGYVSNSLDCDDTNSSLYPQSACIPLCGKTCTYVNESCDVVTLTGAKCSGGGGGGGGGCTPKWDCGFWSECGLSGVKYRECFDMNACDSAIGKPETSMICTAAELCYNGLKDDEEEGIDCGGACLACVEEKSKKTEEKEELISDNVFMSSTESSLDAQNINELGNEKISWSQELKIISNNYWPYAAGTLALGSLSVVSVLSYKKIKRKKKLKKEKEAESKKKKKEKAKKEKEEKEKKERKSNGKDKKQTQSKKETKKDNSKNQKK